MEGIDEEFERNNENRKSHGYRVAGYRKTTGETEKRKSKNSGPGWKFIFALLLLVMVGWGVSKFFEHKGSDNKVVSMKNKVERKADRFVESNKEKTSVPGDVREFVKFANKSSEASKPEYEYSRDGLNKLADALESVAYVKSPENSEIEKSIKSLRKQTKKLEDISTPKQYTNAFDAGYEAINTVQAEAFPGEEQFAKDVKKAAKDFSDKEPAYEQKEEMKDFFEESANAVEAFAHSSTPSEYVN